MTKPFSSAAPPPGRRRSSPRWRSLAALATLAATGCAPLAGTASLTILAPESPPGLELVGAPVEDSVCSTWAAVFALWGEPLTHESMVARMLDRTHADVLLDASLTSSTQGVPFIFLRSCETLKAQPARRMAARAP